MAGALRQHRSSAPATGWCLDGGVSRSATCHGPRRSARFVAIAGAFSTGSRSRLSWHSGFIDLGHCSPAFSGRVIGGPYFPQHDLFPDYT